MNVAECKDSRKYCHKSTGIGLVLTILFKSSIGTGIGNTFSQSIVIGTDNSFRKYCKTLFFSLHLNLMIFFCRKFAAFLIGWIIQFPILLAKFLSYYCLHIIKNIAYQIMEVLISYAHKLMVMGNSKNLCVFNFAILLKLWKSRNFNAREIYMFYSTVNIPAVLQFSTNDN